MNSIATLTPTAEPEALSDSSEPNQDLPPNDDMAVYKVGLQLRYACDQAFKFHTIKNWTTEETSNHLFSAYRQNIINYVNEGMAHLGYNLVPIEVQS